MEERRRRPNNYCQFPKAPQLCNTTISFSISISTSTSTRMVSTTKSHFPFLSFLTPLLFLLVQSTPTLLPSDHQAFLLLHKSFGIQHPPNANPCDSDGIICQQKLINYSYNNNDVLRITRIVFDSHYLKGNLSPAIGHLSELKQLSLPNNHLIGKIPPQIVECHKLEVLDLRNNQFSGNIPPGLSSLIRLQVLDLSRNKFSGSLKSLKYFPNLEKLNLADNLFSGEVPLPLTSFQNLIHINISGNNLIEDDSPRMNTMEELSQESPEKESIPKRYVFAETSSARNQSHSAMAPYSSQDSSAANAASPMAASLRKHKKRKATGWILEFLAGILTGIVSGVIFSWLFKMLMSLTSGRGKGTNLRIFSPMIKRPEDLAFLGREDGLASLHVIGRGGCGEVYRAVLPGINGKEIAIKKIVQVQPNGDTEQLGEEDIKHLNIKMRQIRAEIQTVGKIRHRNLLPLLAHLPRHNCHYLVYEYMKNGSLQDCLQNAAEGRKELDWLARYKIALGVAAGLEYLHENHTTRIIHRDLKPANILLDDNMEARIADFGLAQAVPDANTHFSTSNVAGTVGYIAPEYYQTFTFTEKCDVYSFGVVLGILVIGKLPSDDFFQNTDEMSLVEWMRTVMTSGDPKQAIDPKLSGNGYEEQMLLVLKVACFCTLENPKKRPTSKDARCMLSQINH